jgi:hypothetical protein
MDLVSPLKVMMFSRQIGIVFETVSQGRETEQREIP